MSMDNHIVIMAGGIGSRFWPMSTPECPKQFIDVMGCGRTLIQLTADRFDGVCPRENVWVVTSEKYIDIVREQLPEIPESNILAEPCARNTAPCIAYACWKIKKKHPNANVVVTPSDALVINTGEFRRVVEKALRFTDNSSAIVTLGIKPTRPETGYGYIAAGDQIMTDKEIFTVDAFKEKPDRETADRYLAEGNYFWNVVICCLVAAICLARSGRWLSTDFILASSCNFFRYNWTVSTSPTASPAFNLVPSSTSSCSSFPAASAETITSVASKVPVAS